MPNEITLICHYTKDGKDISQLLGEEFLLFVKAELAVGGVSDADAAD